MCFIDFFSRAAMHAPLVLQLNAYTSHLCSNRTAVTRAALNTSHAELL